MPARVTGVACMYPGTNVARVVRVSMCAHIHAFRIRTVHGTHMHYVQHTNTGAHFRHLKQNFEASERVMERVRKHTKREREREVCVGGGEAEKK